MTNEEKYLKDGVDVEELATKIIEYGVFGDTATWKQAIIEFMNRPAKPTLTEDERVILKNIDMNAYQKITRDETFALILFGKDEEEQIFRCDFDCYNHLFTFIEERRRI